MGEKLFFEKRPVHRLFLQPRRDSEERERSGPILFLPGVLIPFIWKRILTWKRLQSILEVVKVSPKRKRKGVRSPTEKEE